MPSRIVHVAVGVVVDMNGNILIAKRADTAHQGGLWEFPGGKVELGENVFSALKRELYEELAIEAITTQALIKIRHDYGDKIVLLDVHKVTAFEGHAKGNEGQPIEWVAPRDLHYYQFPAANAAIITAINLPNRLLITGQYSLPATFFTQLEKALQQGIQLVQLRLNDSAAINILLENSLQLCAQYSAQLQVNTSPDIFFAMADLPCGLHLNAKNLLSCESRPVAKNILLSASCHNLHEITHAQKMGVDFICLSPVLETQSHPDQSGMGWQAFAALVDNIAVPVFALGGMQEIDLPKALASGAQGIAGISEWWG